MIQTRDDHVSSDDWRPLGNRLGTRPVDYDALHEGVPDHLRESLMAWVLARVGPDVVSTMQRMQRVLRLQGVGTQGPEVAMQGLRNVVRASDDVYLEIVDYLLHVQEETYLAHNNPDDWSTYSEDIKLKMLVSAKDLHFILNEAGSAYAMDFGPPWQIVRRVDPTTRAAADNTISSGSLASRPLASAWAAAFRRDPDYTTAYKDAVLAVEAVACPLFIRNDSEPTLGKAIKHLSDTMDRWTVAGLDSKRTPSATTLLNMLQTVWQNHDRHVSLGGQPPEPVPQEEAEAVVFLAITLVQWFERGFVTRRD